MIEGLYFVTDSKLTKQGILKDTKQVIEAGCRLVQYREKDKPSREMLEEAKQLAKLCKSNGALFIVNDRLDIALSVDADGVHLGQSDLPIDLARKILGKGKIIGTSNHSVEEARQSEKAGADYISVGPVFHTDTKKDAGPPVGLNLLKQIRAITKLPIVGIGGVNEENLKEVLQAGADSVAVISAIVCSNDVEAAARRIIEVIGTKNEKTGAMK